MSIVNRRHLDHALAEYVAHFNHHRPRGLRQASTTQTTPSARSTSLRLRRSDRHGGLVYEHTQVERHG